MLHHFDQRARQILAFGRCPELPFRNFMRERRRVGFKRSSVQRDEVTGMLIALILYNGDARRHCCLIFE
jgi:hypothetical protein